MANVLDYASAERRDFVDSPFSAVDALALSLVAYQNMPDIVPSLQQMTTTYGSIGLRIRKFDIRHPYASVQHIVHAPFAGPTLAQLTARLQSHEFVHGNGPTGLSDPQQTKDLFATLAVNPRFRGIRISAFDQRFSVEQQTQFAAETMLLPDGTLAVAFQGTDDSFVGWKEDFNLAFQYPVPAQISAADYVQSIAGLWKGPIILLGHSKGGNLAVYAAMNVPEFVQQRIRRIYSLDGPGFPPEVVSSPAYLNIIGRIEKIIPDSSVVGMILETPEPCTVVQSTQRGILQHLAFSWKVSNGAFEVLPSVSPGSHYFNTSLNEWIRNLSVDQRKKAVNALFSVMASAGADRFSGMLASLPRALPDMIGSFVGLSDEDRRNIMSAVNLLIKSAWTNGRMRRRNSREQ